MEHSGRLLWRKRLLRERAPSWSSEASGSGKGSEEIRLTRASQNQRHIVRLFLVADPVIDGCGYDLPDLGEGQVTVIAHQVDQALLAEFSKIIFRLGHSVAVCDKNFAGLHFDCAFIVGHFVEQPDDRAAG